MNTLITLVLVTIAILTAIAFKSKKKNKNKTAVDNYNNFHLGEMTSHDIRPKFEKREKDYIKKYSQKVKNKKSPSGSYDWRK